MVKYAGQYKCLLSSLFYVRAHTWQLLRGPVMGAGSQGGPETHVHPAGGPDVSRVACCLSTRGPQLDSVPIWLRDLVTEPSFASASASSP